jgi:hypothetical protein
LRDVALCIAPRPFLDGHLSRIATFRGATRHTLMHQLAGGPLWWRQPSPADGHIRSGKIPPPKSTLHNDQHIRRPAFQPQHGAGNQSISPHG